MCVVVSDIFEHDAISQCTLQSDQVILSHPLEYFACRFRILVVEFLCYIPGSIAAALYCKMDGCDIASGEDDNASANSNKPSLRQCKNVQECFRFSKFYLLQAAIISMLLSSTSSGLPGSMGDMFNAYIGAPQFNSFLSTYADAWDGMTLSTSYSGIDSPAHACAYITDFVSHHLGRQLRWHNMFAIEKDNSARSELKAAIHPPQHTFKRLEDFISDEWKKDFASAIWTMKYEDIISQCQAGAFTKCVAFCDTCNADCRCSTARVHAAGSSCVDFTPQGGRQRSWGPTFGAMVLWLSHRCQLMEDFIFHENVVQHDISLMLAVLANFYVVVSIVLDPQNMGFPVCRPRKLSLMVHKRLFAGFIYPLSYFARLCQREARINWDKFLLATSEQVAADLEWSQSRKSSCFKKEKFEALCDQHAPLKSLAEETQMTRSLGREGLDFLAGYRVLCPMNTLALFFLNQDPDRHEQWSRAKCGQEWAILPALIANNPLPWVEMVDKLQSRLLSPCEALLLMGFITYCNISSFGERVSFSCGKRRSRSATLSQAGNTMHVAVMALLFVYCHVAVVKKAGSSYEVPVPVDTTALSSFLESVATSKRIRRK